MGYDLNAIQQQLDNIQRQYQQLTNRNQTAYPNLNQMVPPSPPVAPRQIQYVDGIAGAKLYQQNMEANSSEVILDRNEDILYCVSKDANGTPARKIQRARFTLEDLPEEEGDPIFLTKKDFDSFKEEIKQMLQQKPTTSTTSTTTKGGTTK